MADENSEEDNVYDSIDEVQCCSVNGNNIKKLQPASKRIQKSRSSISTERAPGAPDAASSAEICDHYSSINSNNNAKGRPNDYYIQRVEMAPQSHYLKLQHDSMTSEIYTNLDEPTPAEDIGTARPQTAYYINHSEI